MMKLFKVKIWLDDGWQPFTIVHKVLANSEVRAGALAISYWKEKNSTNIVQLQGVEELDFTEGVIIQLQGVEELDSTEGVII